MKKRKIILGSDCILGELVMEGTNHLSMVLAIDLGERELSV